MITERNSDIYQRISQSIRNDLISGTEINQCLALSAIGTIAPKDLVEVVVGDIEKMALKDSGRTSMFVRKKAILTLLRIYRKFKDRFSIDDGWSVSINTMLDQKNLGYLSSVISLLYGIVALNSYAGFEENVPKLIKILYKIVINKDCSSDYLYYHTANPWLQVKVLKTLQLFPPPQDSQLISAISDVLNKVISKTEVTKSVNKNNADHGILFEAVNLIIHYRNTVNTELKNQAISLLGVFISVREPNIR
jgi:AP-2 complex subunit alpha